MKRSLLLLFYGMFSILPFSSAVIDCRLACRHCREHNSHPDMLEVYCAMCDECKERRREWLQGPSDLNLRNEGIRSKHFDQQDYQDDCVTTTTDDQCEESVLFNKLTTTSTTTTSTTQRPCTPKPHCVKTTTTTPPCLSMPCPVMMPMMAMPLCPMCPMIGAVPTAPKTSIAAFNRITERIVEGTASTPTPESVYFYVGVPKKLLNDIKINHS